MIAQATACMDNEEMIAFPRTGRPTALVVDDVASSRTSTVEALECFGFVVFTAESMADIDRVARNLTGPLDLLVTEATLPDVRGDVLVRWARMKGLRSPVLYLSRRSPDELRTQGFADRRAPILQTPISEMELARWVRAVLRI